MEGQIFVLLCKCC